MSTPILNRLKILQESKGDAKFWNITWGQGVFLSNLVQIKRPKKILEIGTSNGFSTLFLAKNLQEGSLIDTIEVNEERQKLAKESFETCNLKNINSHLGNVLDILEMFKENKYDIVFVDAGQLKYLEILHKLEKFNLLNDDSILIFDNVTSHKHLEKFIKYVNINYSCELVKIGGGFLVINKKLPYNI